VTGQGSDLASARQVAYDAVSRISWPGMHHRNDIASIAASSNHD
jgi:phosphoribosylamine--glycine ligase